MKQKTVRFYEESKLDMEAYEKLECFREYGFNNARELIIAAVNAYSQKWEASSGIDIDTETLAEAIARKLSKAGIISISNNEVELTTEIDKSDVFDKALNFMESL